LTEELALIGTYFARNRRLNLPLTPFSSGGAKGAVLKHFATRNRHRRVKHKRASIKRGSQYNAGDSWRWGAFSGSSYIYAASRGAIHGLSSQSALS